MRSLKETVFKIAPCRNYV